MNDLITHANYFLQVLTPKDECAKHGKDWMFETPERERPWQTPVDGVLTIEGDRHWVCVKCVMEHGHQSVVRIAEQDRALTFFEEQNSRQGAELSKHSNLLAEVAKQYNKLLGLLKSAESERDRWKKLAQGFYDDCVELCQERLERK